MLTEKNKQMLRISTEVCARFGIKKAKNGWMVNCENGDVYRVTDPEYSNGRIGNCWMKERLKKDDILLCVKHSGDGFHDFILLEVGGNFIKPHIGSTFGAYGGMGEKVMSVSQRDLSTLLDGEEIIFNDNANHRFKSLQL